ncbi:major facilitator superfamily MFS_1 [Parvibaculum lavamentivorans DS-1]|uniref:Major facilitator superfamily MFS_1 n=1 Tax=Parvibaculum lavamentivorans (strain DS-1 / DSM 13023 / NCIMB 13966) TaxID=402881 RepID=A7HTU6_PARL1|nr:MFS transporter [Parvibaculum lavamentivorans]ABS63329.1 major facilitator superfamily MFS_1 [Parvibaculum lavamentivorans DS-1]
MSPLVSLSPIQPRHKRSLGAAIISMGMVNLSMGIAFPLTALILARQGVEPGMIGLSTAAQAAPVFLISPFAPRIMRHFGPANVMMAGLLLAGVSFALMGLYANLLAWFPLRFLLGSAGTLLWATSEAWINSLASEERRGRIIGLYGAAAAAGFALGPTTLVLVGTDVAPFFIGAGLMIAAAAIVATADRSRNHFEATDKPSAMWRLLLIAPAALLVNFFFAAAEESLVTFFPLYAIRSGMAEEASLVLLTVAALGAIVMQPLIGAVADRINRLNLMIGLVIATLAGYLILPFALPGFVATAIALFVVVGFANGIFTLGMVLVGERFRGSELAGASAFTTAMWGTGALVGAPLSGAAMQLWDPHGLIAAILLIFLAYLPFPIVARLRARKYNVD